MQVSYVMFAQEMVYWFASFSEQYSELRASLTVCILHIQNIQISILT